MTKTTNAGKTNAPASSPAASSVATEGGAPNLAGADTSALTIPKLGGDTDETRDLGMASPQPQVLDAEAIARGQGPDARNVPVIKSLKEYEAIANTGVQAMTLAALNERIEDMKRTDQRIEPVNDMANIGNHIEHLAFNEELVIIRIHETSEEGAENPVPLSVNGSTILVPRGEDMIVRRKYAELLMRMKPQSVRTKIDQRDPDNIKNIVEKRSSLRHNFSLIRDDNPKGGHAWMRKILAEV